MGNTSINYNYSLMFDVFFLKIPMYLDKSKFKLIDLGFIELCVLNR